MFRTFLVSLALIIFFIVTLPICLICTLIGLKNKMLCSKIAQIVVRHGFRFILFMGGIRYKVIGLENIPKDTPVLFAGNHRSYFDAALAYAVIPIQLSFISKKEVIKIPFLSWWMKLLNCLFLDRHDLREGLKTILHGIEITKQGYSVFIMPEGTRNHESEMLPFKEGSFKIAEKSGCPILPVAFTKSDEIFELHMPKVKSTKIIIQFGEPIDHTTLDKETRKFLGSYVRSTIETMLVKNEAYR